jgi:hypothetical protein
MERVEIPSYRELPKRVLLTTVCGKNKYFVFDLLYK